MANNGLLTLRKKAEFQTLFKEGERYSPRRWLILNYRRNDQGVFRCGWTIPANVANSVTRNKLRRWCREYFRSRLKEGKRINIDVNIVFRKAETGFYRELSFVELQKTLDLCWSRFEQRSK